MAGWASVSMVPGAIRREVTPVFDHDFFQRILGELYGKFSDWAKVPAAPVVQVRLTDGRDFWVNRIVTSAEVPQAVTFYQEVTGNYRVAFVVPYERVAYVVLHSDIPPEYQKIPEPERPKIGFRIGTEQEG